MAHDVFISYSSKDALTAEAVCHNLEKNGMRCWIAPRNVRAGFQYGAEIIYGVKNCKVLVLLFSENSSNSGHVQNEVERAFGYEKIIIPYRIDNAKLNDNLEYFLSSKHWIDAYPTGDVFTNLIQATKVALGISVNDGVADDDFEDKASEEPMSRQDVLINCIQNGAQYKDSAKALYKEGDTKTAIVHMNQSVDFYRKLVEEFEEMQHLHMLAHLENELGLYYNKLGNIKKALATYENSIRHYEKLNELNDDKFIHDLSITLSNIALEYSKFDKMAAKEYYERCIELRKRVLEKDEDYRPTYEKALASMQKLGV